MPRRPQRSNNLPSTPNRRSFQSQPSTTPLVPPPSHLTNKSTTPAGPPPRSVFGSSYNPANATFPRNHGSALRSFTLPDSSPPRSHEEQDDLPMEPDTQVDYTGVEDSALEVFGRNSTLMSSIGTGARGLKRSRDGKVRTKKESGIPAIARAYAAQRGQQRLPETDDVVLKTEQIIGGLSNAVRRADLEEREDTMTMSVANLTKAWRGTHEIDTKEGNIGPANDDGTVTASYIASFALETHHPHHIIHHSQQNETNGRQPRPRAVSTTLPRALLDWLNAYHNPFPDDFDSIIASRPAPSANESFWDVIYASILRGKFVRAIALLKRAGWEHAVTALDDGASDAGYTGQQLDSTRRCAEQCVQLLASSPAEQAGNWDIKDADWSLFRQQVRAALNDLQAFAGEDGDTVDAEEENIFSKSAQGQFNFSRASKRAGSKVPWSIFENMKLLYSQLLGQVEEILMTSQDWLEASVFLTVWWDGDEIESDLGRSKSAMQREMQRTREVDITPLWAYRARLSDAFALATSESEETGFSVDTTDAAQVGLACAIEDNVWGVLSVLQGLSLPIAAAVADIAALGNWLPGAALTEKGLLEQGFDSQDLLVLSHGPGSGDKSSGVRDDILLLYAELLKSKELFHSATVEREGWEIASSVYSRLDDRRLADQKIAELLDSVNIDSIPRADKVMNLCSALGLAEQAKRVAERFADSLAESNQNYGAILIFYARAHSFDKLDHTLTLLTSFCLVQSTAMPPQDKLDDQLESLLGDRIELLALSQLDPEAAAYLASKLSGYATARTFYDLRDNKLSTQTSRASSKPQRRKMDAAKALLSLVASASDCIRGGLFDPDVQSVVPVDGILVLLGEVIPLCRQSKRLFTSQDIFSLLRVIEDFSAAPARIRHAAEDVLLACKEAAKTRAGGVPSLQKSKSDASTHSGLSESSYELLMASSTMLTQSSRSQAPQAIERAWDWRKGLAGLHADLNARSLVLILRTLLAEELGKVWIEATS